MVFHELLTNACKYGALSNEVGRLSIEWAIDPGKARSTCCCRGRNPEALKSLPPPRSGFGSRLISSTLRASGEISVSYKVRGFALNAEIPMRKVQFRNDLARVVSAP